MIEGVNKMLDAIVNGACGEPKHPHSISSVTELMRGSVLTWWASFPVLLCNRQVLQLLSRISLTIFTTMPVSKERLRNLEPYSAWQGTDDFGSGAKR